MQMFLLGLGLLLFVSVWHYALRRSILDHYRDQLFDLRDELRETYLLRGWDLNSPLYARLRRLTNGYLRSTEAFSLIPFLYLEIRIRANPSLFSAMRTGLEQQLDVEDEALKGFVVDYRRRAFDIMLRYMINGSLLMVSIYSVMVYFTTIRTLLRSLHKGAFQWARRTVAEWFFTKDLVEEHSYRLGTQQRVEGTYKPAS